MSLDEEMAQFILAGVRPVQGMPEEMLIPRRDDVFTFKELYMEEWEAANPGKKPYSPSFPERVLAVVSKAYEAMGDESQSPTFFFLKLQEMCQQEMKADNITPDDIHDEEQD